MDHPNDAETRTALGLVTDLGGNAIVLGGTNGVRLNSFSLADVLSDGRACASMNHCHAAFYAPAVLEALRTSGTPPRVLSLTRR